jgi:predicted RNA-binding Zn-ribbon protein involved in translation (DUF1610 family)
MRVERTTYTPRMATRVCPNCGESIDPDAASIPDSEGDAHGEGQGKQERVQCPNCKETLTRAADAGGGPWTISKG